MTERLALLGGEPAVTAPTPHFVWPEVTDEARRALDRQASAALSIYDRSGVVEELEDRLRSYFGVRHALLTSSGTAALHSMYAAVGAGPGDEVIVPAYTFFATVTPLFHTGAVPVLADCRSDGSLDPLAVEAAVTGRTRAIVATHMWGLPCDMDALRAVADLHGLLLLEDGSHAHGATWRGGRVGALGDAAAFSMQGQKTLTGGEGGFLLTDDDVFYRALLFGHYNRRCRNEIPQDHPLRAYVVTGMGLKLRIHPLAAALAVHELGHLDAVLAGRSAVAARLVEALTALPGLEPIVPAPDATSSWYALLLQYDAEAADGLGVDRLHDALLAEGCAEVDRPGSTRPLNHLPLFQDPTPLFPAYHDMVRYGPGDFPAAERFHERALKLPVWTDYTGVVEQYAAAFTKVVAGRHALLGSAAAPRTGGL